MPYSAARASASGLSSIAQTIAIPNDHRPQRLPSFPNVERTSVVALRSTGTTSVNRYTSANGTIDRGDKDLLLVRNTTYPLWHCESLTNATPDVVSTEAGSIYYITAWQSGAGLGQLNAPGDTINFGNSDIWATLTTGSGSSTTIVNAKNRFALGMVNDERVYLPATYNGQGYTAFGFTSSSCTGEFDLGIEWFDGSDTYDTVMRASFTSTGDSSFNIVAGNSTSRKWWRPTYLALISLTSGAPGTVIKAYAGVTTGGSLTTPTVGPLLLNMPMFAAPEVNVSLQPYQSSRPTAVAALFSNVTAVLNKEGTVNCARIPRSSFSNSTGSYWNMASGGWIASIYPSLIGSANPADRYYGPLEKGLYTFTVPDASSESFRDSTLWVTTGSGVPPIMQLDSFDYVNLITFTDLSSANGGQTMAITLDRHLEFRSTSQLFLVGLSTIPLEAYHSAALALASLGCFFENPTHMSIIAGMVRTAVAKYGPTLYPALKGAARYAGTALIERAASKLVKPVVVVQAPKQVTMTTKPKPARASRNHKAQQNNGRRKK